LSNFLAVGWFDTWPMIASLRQRQNLFPAADEGRRRLAIREPGDGEDVWRHHDEFEKWVPLRNLIAKIRRQPATEGTDTGRILLEWLEPGAVVHWTHHETNWQRFHMALVTNPLCWVFSGAEGLHMQVGFLNWINLAQPTSQLNLGESPRIHLVVEFRKHAQKEDIE